MGASMHDIRQGLKARIETIPDFVDRVYIYVPGTQEPPSVTIVPGTFIPGDTKAAITYDRSFDRGSHDYVFTLAVTVSRTVNPVAEAQLDEFISTDTDKSIKRAIEADDSLGGKVSFCHVQRVIQYGALTWNGLDFFGAQIIVEVTA